MNNIVLVLSVLFFSTQVCAEDIFDVAEEYNKKKSELTELEAKRRQAMAEVYRLDKETQKLVIQKSELDEKKAKFNHDLNQASVEIVQIEEKIQKMTPDLLRRFDLTDKINDVPWLYALLSSQSVGELEQFVDGTKIVNKKQSAELQEFVDLHKQLKEQKIQLSKTAQEILRLKKNMDIEEKKIAANQVLKKRQLTQVNRYLGAKKETLLDLKRRGQVLTQQQEFKDLDILFDMGFFDQRGKLPLPVQGSLVQNFGLNKWLSYDLVKLLHKGHFYKTLGSQKVQSVAAGRVRFSGSVPGFGKVVILDHGSRYYTTYGNLKNQLVKKGTTVDAKQTIGETGAKHLQMGQGLYFEIRHFSEPQDPAQWLKPDTGQLATL